MSDLSSLSDADLLRAAIQETRDAAPRFGWDNRTIQFALSQMYAGTVQGRPELEKVWAKETGPTQARLDLHLTEGSVEGHTAPADQFAKLVSGVAEATKEVTKKRLGRDRYASTVLVRGVGAGSVRLVLEIPPHEDDGRQDSMGELSTVDSESLRQVAAILASADDLTEDSPLTAQIGPLSGNARKALRRAARQIADQHWQVGGRIEQRGFDPSDITITPAGARRLVVELDQAEPAPNPVTLFGQVDGTIDIEGIVWFKPEAGKRFRSVAVDQDIAQAALNLQPGHPRVKADFVVYESLSASDDVLKRSWELRSIVAAPRDVGKQTSIN
ncbi:hypothetical protein [Mycolicibacterium mageritense]|uniref:hypothetical protein n=1 Tax=Mycolicibacterium mageritense TaxID=53462 RepID=UPI001E4D657A|nr:hypothetical protein [Mycolicibacterium mageritense]GJJ21522.1 hypothetical protein MTY414_51950 [Mycolicibacterium mageritense]